MQNIEYRISQLYKIDWDQVKNIQSRSSQECMFTDKSAEYFIKVNLLQMDTIDRITIGFWNIPKINIKFHDYISKLLYDRDFNLISHKDFLNFDEKQKKPIEKSLDIQCDKKVHHVILNFSNPYYQEKNDVMKKKAPDFDKLNLPEKNKLNIQNSSPSLQFNFQPEQKPKKELQINQLQMDKIEKLTDARSRNLKIPEGGGGYNSIVNNLKNSPTQNKEEGYFQYKKYQQQQQGRNPLQKGSFEQLYKNSSNTNEKKQKSILEYNYTSNDDDDLKKAIELSKKEQQEAERKKQQEEQAKKKEQEMKQLYKSNGDDSRDSYDTQILDDDSDNEKKDENKKDFQKNHNGNNINNNKDNDVQKQQKENLETDYDYQIQQAIKLSKQEEERQKLKEQKEMEEQIRKINKSSSIQQMEEEEEDIQEVESKSNKMSEDFMKGEDQKNNQKSEKKSNYLLKLSQNQNQRVNLNIKLNNIKPTTFDENERSTKDTDESNSFQNKNKKDHSSTKNNQNNKNAMEEEITNIDNDNDNNGNQVEDKYKNYLNRNQEDSVTIQRKLSNQETAKKNIWNTNGNMEIEKSNKTSEYENLEKMSFQPKLKQTKLFENSNPLKRQDNQESRKTGGNQPNVSINISDRNNQQCQLRSHFEVDPTNLSDRFLRFQRQQEIERKIPEKCFLYKTSKHVLKDKRIVISGYQDDQRDRLKQIVKELGAIYSPELTEICDFMITKDKKTDKYSQYLRNKQVLKNLKVVDQKFLQMCKVQKKLVDYKEYLIE